LKTCHAGLRVHKQTGKGNLGCLFSLLIVAGLGYLGYKFAPHYVDHFRLKDAMEEIAVHRAVGSRSGATNKAIQNEVLEKAKELGIPLKREGIRVQQEQDRVSITVKYTIPVALANHVYDWNFEFATHN